MVLSPLKYGMVTLEGTAHFFLGPVTENFVILCWDRSKGIKKKLSQKWNEKWPIYSPLLIAFFNLSDMWCRPCCTVFVYSFLIIICLLGYRHSALQHYTTQNVILCLVIIFLCFHSFQDWFRSSSVSLAKLDEIKASVYNINPDKNAQSLRPTSAVSTRSRGHRGQSYTDLQAEPPLSTVGLHTW